MRSIGVADVRRTATARTGGTMIPIQDVLHRIRWDAQFGAARFVIGYLDRVAHRIVKVPIERIRFPSGEHFAFEAVEDDGSVHTVPLHRVREVWRNGALIWHRNEPTHD